MNVFLFHFQGGTNGPETISIKGENIPDGVTAMYYIKDYSNVIGQGSMSFKQSDAKVHFKLSYLQFWGTLNEKLVEQIFSKIHNSVYFFTNQDDSFYIGDHRSHFETKKNHPNWQKFIRKT